MQKIFIEINRTCKKECYFCYNTKKSRRHTEPKLMNILRSIFKLVRGKKDLNLIFSGGEPVYSLEKIEKIVNKLKKSGYKTTTTLITNLEIINENFRDFIINHKPYLVLSYNKKTQSLLKRLKNICPRDKIFIRFTLTPENLSTIFDKINELISKKYYIGISPAYRIKWDDISLKKLSKIYLKLTNIINREFIYDFEKILLNKFTKLKQCNATNTMNAIDINGDIYPCHRAIYNTELKINHSIHNDNCKRCPALKFCIPCIYKDIPGEGCKIRVAITPAYELLYTIRRLRMKKKIKISYKGKKYEIPEAVLRKYSKQKKSTSKKNNRNFYELGESDCY